MRVLTGRRKAVMASVAVAVLAGTVAFAGARWLANGEGTGQARAGVAQALTVASATPTTELFPGGTAHVGTTISNPNPYPVVVDVIAQVDGEPITSDTVGCDETNHAVTYTDQTGSWTVPAEDSLEVQLEHAVSMGGDSADACQGAIFTIPLRVEGGVGSGGGGGGDVGAAPDPSTCDPLDFVGVPSAEQLAAAIGLCPATTGGAGLLSATILQGDGTTLGSHPHTGVLQIFGTHVLPLQNSTFAVLSNGTARDLNDPGYSDAYSGAGVSTNPTGLKIGSPDPACPAGSSVNDDPNLTVALRAPTGATGFRFDYNFYSDDYDSWLCNSVTDNFYVVMDPAPDSASGGNIAFDTLGNPVTANSSQHCEGCPHGTTILQGTGFEGYGATGWNPVTAPVTAGQEFTLRFFVWDSSDQIGDSTVLLDDFEWLTS